MPFSIPSRTPPDLPNPSRPPTRRQPHTTENRSKHHHQPTNHDTHPTKKPNKISPKHLTNPQLVGNNQPMTTTERHTVHTIQWKTYDGDTPVSLGAFTTEIVAREIAERFYDHLMDTNHSWKSHEVTVTTTTNSEAQNLEWALLLGAITDADWEWSHTGGGCMAITTTLPDGRYLMITDEGLTDDISPTEPVTLGIYPCYDTDEEGTYHPFPNMGELLAEIGALTN